MARDLELGIKSKSDTAALAAAAAEVDKLKRKADDLGDEFRQASRDAAGLDRELAKLAVESRLLAKEFAASDGEVRNSLKTKVDANRSAANELKKIRADIIGDTERDAKRASAAIAGAAKDLAKLGDGVQAGPSIRSIGDLERALLSARTAVKSFSVEYARTGDESLLRKIKEARSEFEKLAGVAKNIDVFDTKTGKKGNLLDSLIGDGTKAGTAAAGTFASAFEGGLMGTFKALPPEAKAALVASVAGAAIAAAPFIVSAINGAILAGVGAGGLAAGIALVAGDPKVAGAFQDLGDHVFHDLKAAAEPFKAELVDAAGDFGQAWKAIQPNITGFFAALAPVIGHLSEAAAQAATILGPALERAAGPAAQVLDAIASEIPEIAQQIGFLLDDISEHGDSAAEAIKFIFVSVEALIAGFDILVKTVGPAADTIVHMAQAMHLIDAPELDHKLFDLTGTVEEVGKAASTTADQIAQISDAFTKLGQSAEGDFTNKILDSMFAMQDATLGFQGALNKLDDTVKKNGTSLDIHTDKGLANAKGLVAAAKAAADLYAQTLATTGSTEQASAAYSKATGELYKAAAAAGYNSKEVDNLIGKYGKVPERVQTILATIGLTTALDHLSQILIDFGSLNNKDFKTKYTVTTEYIVKHTGSVGGKESGSKYALGGIRRAAEGLIVPPSDPGSVLFGEPQTGGEALIPLKGISRSRAMSLVRPVADSYGFDVGARSASAAAGWGAANRSGASAGLTVNFTGDTSSAFATAFMGLVRTGVIQIGAS